ncbi:MAG: hypothetical protein C0404_10990, partial [Verrucomicrobia bacterium]|nr:hypothetical protein [Verrucomicrobiota bacterium]
VILLVAAYEVVATLYHHLTRHAQELESLVQARTSDLQRTNEILRQSEDRFRMAAETANDAVYEWDLKQSVQWFGKIDEMLGYEPGEFPRTLDGWAALVHPDDLNRVMAEVQAHLERSAPYATEYRVRRKDGAYRWWTARGAAARMPDGTPVRWVGSITDVTERKRAEEALQLKNLVFDASIAANAIADSLGNISEANDAFLRIHGYPNKDDVIGKPIPYFLNDPDKAVAIIAALNGAGQWEGDFTAKRKDGSTFIAHSLATTVKDENGKTIGYQTAIIDVNENKLMETRLRESEVFFRTFVGSLPLLVWTCQGDGPCDFLSSQWIEYTGIPVDKQLGFGWLEQLHADDKERTINTWNEAVRNNTDFNVEFRIRRHDGAYRWFKTRAIAVRDSNGKIMKWFGSNTDVEDIKKSQEELRRHRDHLEQLVGERTAELIQSKRLLDETGRLARVGGWELDIVKNELTWTDTVYQIHEVSRDFRPSVDTGIDFYAPEAVPVISECVKQAVENGKSFDVELQLITARKNRIWVRAVGQAYKEGGKFVKIGGVFHDIDSRKKAEMAIQNLNEELRHKMAELEAANRELEAFSYSVSHDLRAPLRAIDGFSQAILEDYAGKLDDQGRDYLNRLRLSSQRMAQLIDDLLKLSRVTRSEMCREVVDLSAMVRKRFLELQNSEPGRLVEFAIAPRVQVNGDRNLLAVVMENLLHNAWKYTGKHPSAHIEFGVTEKDGKTVYFVKDDGAGFDMKYKDKLFAPFQRLHAVADFPGTGIGLATIQRIVRRHGGEIWAEAHVEKGATFFFTLD